VKGNKNEVCGSGNIIVWSFIVCLSIEIYKDMTVSYYNYIWRLNRFF
jgi:hypothetical protein